MVVLMDYLRYGLNLRLAVLLSALFVREATLSAPGVWILPGTIPDKPAIIAGQCRPTQAARGAFLAGRRHRNPHTPIETAPARGHRRGRMTLSSNLQPAPDFRFCRPPQAACG